MVLINKKALLSLVSGVANAASIAVKVDAAEFHLLSDWVAAHLRSGFDEIHLIYPFYSDSEPYQQLRASNRLSTLAHIATNKLNVVALSEFDLKEYPLDFPHFRSYKCLDEQCASPEGILDAIKGVRPLIDDVVVLPSLRHFAIGTTAPSLQDTITRSEHTMRFEVDAFGSLLSSPLSSRVTKDPTKLHCSFELNEDNRRTYIDVSSVGRVRYHHTEDLDGAINLYFDPRESNADFNGNGYFDLPTNSSEVEAMEEWYRSARSTFVDPFVSHITNECESVESVAQRTRKTRRASTDAYSTDREWLNGTIFDTMTSLDWGRHTPIVPQSMDEATFDKLKEALIDRVEYRPSTRREMVSNMERAYVDAWFSSYTSVFETALDISEFEEVKVDFNTPFRPMIFLSSPKMPVSENASDLFKCDESYVKKRGLMSLGVVYIAPRCRSPHFVIGRVADDGTSNDIDWLAEAKKPENIMEIAPVPKKLVDEFKTDKKEELDDAIATYRPFNSSELKELRAMARHWFNPRGRFMRTMSRVIVDVGGVAQTFVTPTNLSMECDAGDILFEKRYMCPPSFSIVGSDVTHANELCYSVRNYDNQSDIVSHDGTDMTTEALLQIEEQWFSLHDPDRNVDLKSQHVLCNGYPDKGCCDYNSQFGRKTTKSASAESNEKIAKFMEDPFGKFEEPQEYDHIVESNYHAFPSMFDARSAWYQRDNAKLECNVSKDTLKKYAPLLYERVKVVTQDFTESGLRKDLYANADMYDIANHAHYNSSKREVSFCGMSPLAKWVAEQRLPMYREALKGKIKEPNTAIWDAHRAKMEKMRFEGLGLWDE